MNQINEPICEDEEEDEDYVPSDGDDDKGESSESECDDESRATQSKEESAVLQSEKLDEEALKQKADELWADLRKEGNHKKRETNEANKSSLNESTVKVVATETKKKTDPVVQVFEFAGEEVKVQQDLHFDSKTQKLEEKNSKSETTKTSLPKRSSSGLGSLLANINKKPKLSTLTKSKLDWQLFKKEEGCEEELSQHRSSKDNFVERQAFLQRSDLRQFEEEKSIREKNRLKK
ncbi:craniofacial development protein 1-like protein [Leptotrombidium deliense]|uniref:Craniofacial development protein 1 n=1 Tax=Leptotrombidium deliense TaxID=299467 RepID=A0A443SF30_9ACAR|nr:craniofacial development protein 1-like protein [Leptotrombidium deliense]